MDADPLADTDPEIDLEPVRLYREPWTNGRLRSALLRCDNDERIVVRTEDGTAEYDLCGVVRWYEPIRGRWVTTLTVAPCDPEAEFVRLELAEEGR